MIGNPQWFEPRKFGWGIRPKTWQGWLYVAGMLLIPLLVWFIPSTLSFTTKFFIFDCWLLLVVADTTDIMIRMPKDERTQLHEALAERNVSRFIVVALAIWLVLLIASAAISWFVNHEVQYIWTGSLPTACVIAAILMGGAIVKRVSHRYLDK